MIDLNRTSKKQDEAPIGLVILTVIPFILSFWLAASLIGVL